MTLALAAAIAMIGCGQKEEPKPQAAAPAAVPAPAPAAPPPKPEVTVKLGHVAPLTGPQAHLGKDNENGARMAIDELNAQALEIGGAKIKFELMVEDDQCRSEAGHHRCPEAGRRQGQRCDRSPQLRHHNPGLQALR